ncbi:hypothetical protein AeMF1_006244 [Aphanomyces euteiches]|nr:hypothetical protein AeMF1_006244 [Aphanomyces euteiches]KAH9182174.1 hypothetical protein AeNC1_015850 [Aphanomyces euteiches]
MARRYGFLYDEQRFAMLEAILGIQDVEEDICGDFVHMYRLEDATDSLLGTCCRLWQDTRGNIVNLIEWTNYDIVALSPTTQPHDRLGHGIFNGYSIRVRLDGSPCAMPPSHGAVFDPVVRYVLCFPEDAKHIHASTFKSDNLAVRRVSMSRRSFQEEQRPRHEAPPSFIMLLPHLHCVSPSIFTARGIASVEVVVVGDSSKSNHEHSVPCSKQLPVVRCQERLVMMTCVDPQRVSVWTHTSHGGVSLPSRRLRRCRPCPTPWI